MSSPVTIHHPFISRRPGRGIVGLYDGRSLGINRKSLATGSPGSPGSPHRSEGPDVASRPCHANEAS
ncbi:MAG: hypothetical protein ACF8TS_08510, partial [Maioricimonas sp. JB049]